MTVKPFFNVISDFKVIIQDIIMISIFIEKQNNLITVAMFQNMSFLKIVSFEKKHFFFIHMKQFQQYFH